MGYQASKVRLKAIVCRIFNLRAFVFICLAVVSSLDHSFSQTTTNPLSVDITVTATVLQNPGVNPDTPPIPPGPQGPMNMSEVDVALFRGFAYPNSTVSLIKNGVLLGQVQAASNGSFEIHVHNLAPGTYSFGIRAEDGQKLQSKLLLFTIFISTSITTVVDGIFIPPTLTSDKVEVKKGESVVFSGTSIPNAEIRLSVTSQFELLKKVFASSSGFWTYTLDTASLTVGNYTARVRSLTKTDLSPYSDDLSFRVGDTTRLRAKIGGLTGFRKKCDLNNDNRVNLLDFSIMAFWYKRIGFPAPVDLNSDKSINLTDLSILAYCWTG